MDSCGRPLQHGCRESLVVQTRFFQEARDRVCTDYRLPRIAAQNAGCLIAVPQQGATAPDGERARERYFRLAIRFSLRRVYSARSSPSALEASWSACLAAAMAPSLSPAFFR